MRGGLVGVRGACVAARAHDCELPPAPLFERPRCRQRALLPRRPTTAPRPANLVTRRSRRLTAIDAVAEEPLHGRVRKARSDHGYQHRCA